MKRAVEVTSVNKPQLIFHLGAHKTATTHFQDTLSLMTDELASYGVTYHSRGVVRSKLRRIISSPFTSFAFKHSPYGIQNRICQHMFIPGDAEQVFVSDENIIGSCVDELSIHPYRGLDRRVGFIRSLLKSYSVKILFSVRNFKRVYPGAYTTALRFEPEVAIKARKSLTDMLNDEMMPRWTDVIARVRAALPGADIYVWSQEKYKSNPADIIRNVLNIPDLVVPSIDDPKETITPNKLAVNLVESRAQKGDINKQTWLTECDAIYHEHCVNDESERYTFLNDAQIQLLKDSYELDLIELRCQCPSMNDFL